VQPPEAEFYSRETYLALLQILHRCPDLTGHEIRQIATQAVSLIENQLRERWVPVAPCKLLVHESNMC